MGHGQDFKNGKSQYMIITVDRGHCAYDMKLSSQIFGKKNHKIKFNFQHEFMLKIIELFNKVKII